MSKKIRPIFNILIYEIFSHENNNLFWLFLEIK